MKQLKPGQLATVTVDGTRMIVRCKEVLSYLFPCNQCDIKIACYNEDNFKSKCIRIFGPNCVKIVKIITK